MNFNFNKKILISYHSLTINIKKGRKDFNELLTCLEQVKNTSIVFSYPNHDVDSDYIIAKMNEFVKKIKTQNYLNLLVKKTIINF